VLLRACTPSALRARTRKTAITSHFDFPDWRALLEPAVPPIQTVKRWGSNFPNQVGIAYGLDKQAEHVGALSALGFGFLELGGVTPRPSRAIRARSCSASPRRKRLINRYVLNSVGSRTWASESFPFKKNCVRGVNIGKKQDTTK